jgi:ribosome recycling factor
MNQRLAEFEAKMEKSIHHFQNDLNSVRAGRANPAVLDKVRVEYYGVATPLAQVGSLSVPEPQTIVIQPWDATILGDIERAINMSDIGIHPQNDGKVIRLNFPPLTEERRKELAKSLHKKAEETRVAIRGIRRDAMDFFKKQQKSSEITEDDLKDLEGDIQKLTDRFIKEIDTLLSKKEKDILEV